MAAGQHSHLVSSLCLSLGLHPFLLVLLSPEALVVVALGFEELLEVGLAVDNTLQRSIRASTGGEGEG